MPCDTNCVKFKTHVFTTLFKRICLYNQGIKICMEMKHRKFRIAVTSGDGMRGRKELCYLSHFISLKRRFNSTEENINDCCAKSSSREIKEFIKIFSISKQANFVILTWTFHHLFATSFTETTAKLKIYFCFQ